MKVVQAIAALAFLAVGAYGTAQFQNAITGATVNALTLTASSNTSNTATNWGITIVSTSPTYQGDADGNGIHVVFNATFSGYLPLDGYGNPVAYLILPTAYVNPDNGGCATESQVMLPFGGSQANYETDVVYDAQNLYPLYTAAATGVTGTIVLQFPPGNEVARKSFTFNVVAPLFAPSTNGINPSVSSFSLPTTAATLTTGANVSIAGAVEGDYIVTLYYTATTGFPGIAWAQACAVTVAVSATTGSCLTTDFTTLTPMIGSWCGNVFTGSPAVGVTSFIAGNTLQLASVSIEAQSLQNQMKYFAGSSSPFNSAQITIAAGSSDVTPPVCTGATFATPLDVNTDTPQSRVLTIACNDGTGVGVAYSGAFAHAQSTTGITYESSVYDGTSTPTYNIPPHFSGSVSLVGIWAMDRNGNSVVYGRCISGAYTTICGGSSASSSSAVVASISLVIALILAVLAL